VFWKRGSGNESYLFLFFSSASVRCMGNLYFDLEPLSTCEINLNSPSLDIRTGTENEGQGMYDLSRNWLGRFLGAR
jgi:hypothetical protein